MTNYKFIKDPDGSTNSVESIVSTKTYTKDGKEVTEVEKLIIPFAEGNSHYAEYLEWVAEGNTAEAAD